MTVAPISIPYLPYHILIPSRFPYYCFSSVRRVAPTQGIDFYHALKARYGSAGEGGNRKVEMLVFEGKGHPLDGIEAARVSYDVAKKCWSAQDSNRYLYIMYLVYYNPILGLMPTIFGQPRVYAKLHTT